jgi:glc operon protein GlcG
MSDKVTEPDLGEDIVQALIEAGLTAARRCNVCVSLAIVDAGGHLLGFLRMSGVHTATTEVAQAKARSAAAFRRSTRSFAQQLADGNLALLAVPGCVPLPGGIPLLHRQRMIGAAGVSGASPDVDEAIAETMYDHLHKNLLQNI